MSKNDKKFILDEFHENCDLQINLQEVDTNYLVGKFDDDNIFKWMKHKEIKEIIHDFYKKEHAHISQFTDDKKYRELIFKLYQHLGCKSQFDDFTVAEKALLHLLHTYTDSLVNEFKLASQKTYQQGFKDGNGIDYKKETIKGEVEYV